MENAGARCAQAVLRAWRRLRGSRPDGRRRAPCVLVVCGCGGNGGDGYVAARHLHLEGVPLRVLAVGVPRPGSDAADARAAWRALGASAAATLSNAGRVPAAIVLDALLGTGVSRPAVGAHLEAILLMNRLRRQGARIYSIDLPSGIETDTGQPCGAAVKAHVTIAIAATKQGLAREASRPFRGRVVVVPFGAPAQLRG